MADERRTTEPHDPTEGDLARFWAKVTVRPDVGCWLWAGAGAEYGQFRFAGKPRQAHRVAWLIAYGEWPDLLVLHRCDTPRCVRPDHLFLGTDADNAADRDAKGRWARIDRSGERNGRAKLTTEQVDAIRALAVARSRASLAREFGVTPQTIGKIVLGRRWNG